MLNRKPVNELRTLGPAPEQEEGQTGVELAKKTFLQKLQCRSTKERALRSSGQKASEMSHTGKVIEYLPEEHNL